jgi:hypothetical protein
MGAAPPLAAVDEGVGAGSKPSRAMSTRLGTWVGRVRLGLAAGCGALAGGLRLNRITEDLVVREGHPVIRWRSAGLRAIGVDATAWCLLQELDTWCSRAWPNANWAVLIQ